MDSLNKLTIKDASDALQSGDISSVDLTEACLGAIKAEDPEINAFITVTEKEALEAAKESDKQYAASRKRRSPIDGIPIAIKDVISTEGILTTGASKILENYNASYDATVVKRLKDAGAVIIGKTNCDEFAMGSSTENSAYGSTRNPRNLEYVPGGSSGGSAAAVAGDLAIGALGTDTGGSIRQPASFCGIVGFKPTYGAVSRYGLLAMTSSFDQAGPMTKTVEDAEILFKIIAGHDERDSTSITTSFRTGWQQDPESRSPMSDAIRLEDDIKKMTIGVPREYFAEGLDPKVKDIINKSIEKLKSLGAQIIDISLPHSKYALSSYYIMVFVEVASNLSRYDGIKYGYSIANSQQLTANSLLDVYLKSRSIGFGAEAKRRIILGTYASSAGYIDQYYNQAQKVRALIKKDFDEAFKKVDFIVGPVAPTTAFKIGEKSSDPLSMYLSDIYTIAVNLAGLPAISIPAGEVDKLPVGLQIIGPQMSDLDVLNLGKVFESARWRDRGAGNGIPSA